MSLPLFPGLGQQEKAEGQAPKKASAKRTPSAALKTRTPRPKKQTPKQDVDSPPVPLFPFCESFFCRTYVDDYLEVIGPIGAEPTTTKFHSVHHVDTRSWYTPFGQLRHLGWEKKPVGRDWIAGALLNEYALAVRAYNKTKFIIIDLDDHGDNKVKKHDDLPVQERVKRITYLLRLLGIKYLLFKSPRGYGCHIFIYFEQEEYLESARAFVSFLVSRIGLDIRPANVEIYPCGTDASKGTAVRLPCVRGSTALNVDRPYENDGSPNFLFAKRWKNGKVVVRSNVLQQQLDYFLLWCRTTENQVSAQFGITDFVGIEQRIQEGFAAGAGAEEEINWDYNPCTDPAKPGHLPGTNPLGHEDKYRETVIELFGYNWCIRQAFITPDVLSYSPVTDGKQVEIPAKTDRSGKRSKSHFSTIPPAQDSALHMGESSQGGDEESSRYQVKGLTSDPYHDGFTCGERYFQQLHRILWLMNRPGSPTPETVFEDSRTWHMDTQGGMSRIVEERGFQSAHEVFCRDIKPLISRLFASRYPRRGKTHVEVEDVEWVRIVTRFYFLGGCEGLGIPSKCSAERYLEQVRDFARKYLPLRGQVLPIHSNITWAGYAGGNRRNYGWWRAATCALLEIATVRSYVPGIGGHSMYYLLGWRTAQDLAARPEPAKLGNASAWTCFAGPGFTVVTRLVSETKMLTYLQEGGKERVIQNAAELALFWKEAQEVREVEAVPVRQVVNGGFELGTIQSAVKQDVIPLRIVTNEDENMADEKTIKILSDVLDQQAKTIQMLTEQNSKLMSMLEHGMSGAAQPRKDQPPPRAIPKLEMFEPPEPPTDIEPPPLSKEELMRAIDRAFEIPKDAKPKHDPLPPLFDGPPVVVNMDAVRQQKNLALDKMRAEVAQDIKEDPDLKRPFDCGPRKYDGVSFKTVEPEEPSVKPELEKVFTVNKPRIGHISFAGAFETEDKK